MHICTLKYYSYILQLTGTSKVPTGTIYTQPQVVMKPIMIFMIASD